MNLPAAHRVTNKQGVCLSEPVTTGGGVYFMPLPNMIPDTPPLALGTPTRWGKIEMVGITGGERYYWMTDKSGCVSMMPAMIVEPDVKLKVLLPSEAGIARPPQPPAKRPRPKADPLRRKWITKREAIAKGYSL